MQKLAKDIAKGDRFIYQGETVTVTGRGKARWDAANACYSVFVRNGRGQGMYVGINGTIELA